jgi:hypothetical protein
MRRPSKLRIPWHPHQKLWNWELIALIRARFGTGLLGQTIEAVVIGAELVLLAVCSRARRGARATGAGTRQGDRSQVLYIDCGLHKQAEQVQWMQRWFGERYELHVLAFEAGVEHARDAAVELAGLERLRLHHLALVGPDYVGDEVRLYKSPGKGKADSLFSERGEHFEVVPASRLSTVLAEDGWDITRTPTILRMNIEGAEQFVVADLLASGLTTAIDGYYGLWDDLSKIDPAADERFQNLLAEHGISTLTFNDRDLETAANRPSRLSLHMLPATLRELAFRLRRRVIRRDIEAAFEAGVARAQANGSTGVSP